jgi:hypothetical protein
VSHVPWLESEIRRPAQDTDASGIRRQKEKGHPMNPISAIDRKLLAIAGGPSPETIDDVIQLMENIDKLLHNNDGLKWFNRLSLSMQDKVTGALGRSLLRVI